MPKLDDKTAAWVEGLLGHLEANERRLSDWERGFIADQRKRYESYGSEMLLSDKQMGVLRRVADKTSYDAPPDDDLDDAPPPDEDLDDAPPPDDDLDDAPPPGGEDDYGV